MLNGYRTYLAAAAMVALAAAQYLGIAIPPETVILLNGLGLGFLRAAIPKV